MNTIAAKVATSNGSKYVRQLCNHWSHKLEVEQHGDAGKVTFPNGVAAMAADEEGIVIRVTGENREQLVQLTEVIARHLDRFAFREAPLTYDWSWE